MRLFKTTSLIAVVPAADVAASRQWYARFLGEPDEIPMDGMAPCVRVRVLLECY